MFDADFRAKPVGFLAGPPQVVEGGITFDCGAGFDIGSPGGGSNGLKVPWQPDLFATFPDLCVFAVVEIWENRHNGLRIEALGHAGGGIISTVYTAALAGWIEYPLFAPDGNPSIRRLRFWNSNGEPFLARLRAQ